VSDAGSPSRAAQPDVGVVIVAAGSGSRTGSSELKQFRWIAGKPMLLHSLQKFQRRPDVAMVVCVLPRDYAADPPPWIFQCDTDRLLVSVGGPERQDSVWNGVEDLPEETRIVVVHDAARPFVTDEAIAEVICEARKGHGAIAALPMVDTVKETEDDKRISRTVSRTRLWRAQTPQAFPRDLLVQAYTSSRRHSLPPATDEASLLENAGLPVVIVPGSELAMKITEEADFARAEALHALEA
jgi:2-C-methyl-D-erythritol 4-phosphate cytidylyltransferase